MLVTFIIILILIGAAVVSSIYSNILTFYSNFAESENYHKAYYASVSALERGELVVKQRKPGYEGSGGFIEGAGTGSTNNTSGGSDNRLSGFSYLWDNRDQSTVFRTINSKTNRIPKEGKGDVEDMLATGDSKNYNMMGYENAEIFLLYNDNGGGNPYTGGNIENADVGYVSGEIRLPPLLSGKFGPLDTSKPLISLSNSLPGDDAIVDRQIRGQVNSGGTLFPFTIYSTPYINFGGSPTVRYTEDSVFRESDINEILKFKFLGDDKSPLERGDHAELTIISQAEDDINPLFTTSGLPGNIGYSRLFKNTTNPQLRFSLLNLVQGLGGTGQIYPYLEYYATFSNPIPDKYFTINAEGAFKDYQINTIIQKPTVKESILGNFTSIF